MLRIDTPAAATVGEAAETTAPARTRGARATATGGAAVVETARASRMSRSLARVITGGEALGGPVADKQVGAAAAAIAQGQAATWLPLLRIARSETAMRQNELAASLSLDGSSVVRLLDSLENSGLIERCEDRADRRAKSLTLTARGRRTVDQVERQHGRTAQSY